MDKLDESILSLKEALNEFGYNDIYRAVIFSKLSVVYRYKEDSKQSLYYAEKAKEISDQQHGTKHHPGKLLICSSTTILQNEQCSIISQNKQEQIFFQMTFLILAMVILIVR